MSCDPHVDVVFIMNQLNVLHLDYCFLIVFLKKVGRRNVLIRHAAPVIHSHSHMTCCMYLHFVHIVRMSWWCQHSWERFIFCVLTELSLEM